jgi:hypothetical protein
MPYVYNYYSQYRPVSTSETSAQDAVSVRAMKDMADSVNNCKAYVKRQKLLSYMFVPAIDTVGDAVTRLLLPPLAPRFMPSGYNYMWIAFHAERTAGSGITNIVVNLCTSLYSGPAAIIGYPTPRVYYNRQATTSGFYVVQSSPLVFVKDYVDRVWPLVTYNSAVGTTHRIRTLDVWLSMDANY